MIIPASRGLQVSSPLLSSVAQLYATVELFQYPEPAKGKNGFEYLFLEKISLLNVSVQSRLKYYYWSD